MAVYKHSYFRWLFYFILKWKKTQGNLKISIFHEIWCLSFKFMPSQFWLQTRPKQPVVLIWVLKVHVCMSNVTENFMNRRRSTLDIRCNVIRLPASLSSENDKCPLSKTFSLVTCVLSRVIVVYMHVLHVCHVYYMRAMTDDMDNSSHDNNARLNYIWLIWVIYFILIFISLSSHGLELSLWKCNSNGFSVI